MSMKPLALALAITCLAGVDGCTRPHRGAAGDMAAPSRAPTTLLVQNQAFLDMDVFVLVQGQGRRRLGTATGNSNTTMTIPATLLFGPTTLRFIADPIGGQHAEVSTSIQVNPGDQVTMTIPPA